ncbi:hypothetical protein LX32DRAFT_652249 [Colletotrichum zoysiae]|uniref:Uncharacterized protein n=1 Tax=Colletotrichum zoysiae TaxID=1216348 RepID=A0AAD9M1R3_9PEZI|nr:hypothetical protein LX32DRAFT_652249 [Colletotrichum zoysiae]
MSLFLAGRPGTDGRLAAYAKSPTAGWARVIPVGAPPGGSPGNRRTSTAAGIDLTQSCESITGPSIENAETNPHRVEGLPLFCAAYVQMLPRSTGLALAERGDRGMACLPGLRDRGQHGTNGGECGKGTPTADRIAQNGVVGCAASTGSALADIIMGS